MLGNIHLYLSCFSSIIYLFYLFFLLFSNFDIQVATEIFRSKYLSKNLSYWSYSDQCKLFKYTSQVIKNFFFNEISLFIFYYIIFVNISDF